MKATETDIQEIQTKISPLLGKKVWRVTLGIGSFITMEFGNLLPLRGQQKSPRGEWYLWVSYCAWRLEAGNDVIAGSEDPRPKLEKAVQLVSGLALESIVLYPPALDTVLTFEGGVALRLFSIYTEEYEHWKLFTPDEKVLIIGPGTGWSYVSADE